MWKKFTSALPMKTWMILLFILIVVLGLLSIKASCSMAHEARRDATQARATGKALDKVADQTDDIRQDQQEQQREVDEIEGADEPLPDGFGAELERVRRGRDRDTR